MGQWPISYMLAVQDIELRYRRSLLGPLWVSAALIVTILALAYVFSGVFGASYVHYVSYVAAGLLTWQLLSTLVTDACSSVIDNTSLLQNAPLSLGLVAGRVALRNAMIFAHNFIAVTCLLLFFGVSPTPFLIFALPGALFILILGFSASLMLGPLCARFRDVPLIVQNLMQVVFFLTPIFWIPTAASHRPSFIEVNPFYHFIQLVRAPMLGEAPTLLDWESSALCCAAVIFLAALSVSMTRKRLTLWL